MMQRTALQCAATSQRRTQLSIAFYFARDAAVLRVAVAAGSVRTRGNGRFRAFGSAVAGRDVASQALGVHRRGRADFRQFRLRLRDCAKTSTEKRWRCDPNDPAACQTASRFSRIVLWCSAVLYMVGCFTAYILGPLLVRFD